MENQDLTIGDPGRIIRNYCMPLMGSVFFQQMYNLADSFVAGRYIGENALAAVGNGYGIAMIYLAVAMGCNTGCSVNTARNFGAKDYQGVRTAISTALSISAVICIFLTVGGILLAEPLLALIRTPDSVFTEAVTYLRIYTYGLPFMMLYNIATGIFSALGDSGTPFCFLALSSVANIALDILFVHTFSMGVAGVGYATVFCQGVACILAVLVVRKRIQGIPGKGAPLITGEAIKEFLYITVTGTAQQGIIVIGNMIIQGVVNTYGAAVSAGYAVSVKLINLSTSFFGTIGTGVTNYTAQNLGAGLPGRVREGFKASVKFVWTIALVTGILCEFFPDVLVKIFLIHPTDIVQRTAVDFLRIASPFYFAPAIKIMCDSVLCGSEKMGLVVFSLALDLGLRALAAALCSAIFHTAFSIWFAWPIGWVIAAWITFGIYRRVMKIKEKG